MTSLGSAPSEPDMDDNLGDNVTVDRSRLNQKGESHNNNTDQSKSNESKFQQNEFSNKKRDETHDNEKSYA